MISLSAADRLPLESSQRGKCLLRGECDQTENVVGEVAIPCVDRHDPHYLDDREIRDTFKNLCPEFSDDPLVCCTAEQIDELKQSMDMPQQLGLSRCPSCDFNWRLNFCQMACSPNQSDFLQITESSETDDGRQKVDSVNYHVTSAYADQMYASCSDVRSAISDQPLLDFMCGSHGSANCSGPKWLEFLGTSVDNGGQSPYHINYVFHDTSDEQTINGHRVKPMNAKTSRCNEIAPGADKACSCVDCKLSCI